MEGRETEEIKLANKKGKTDSGLKLSFAKFELKKRHSFLDFIFGGCEIGLSIAVDFTLSNGKPSSRDSLHYLDM